MANLLRGILGGQKPSPQPSAADSDFADYVGAPDPAPASAPPVSSVSGIHVAPTTNANAIPYTKWYRIWERTTPRDFLQEAIIIPTVLLLILFHVWGRRKNRRKAQAWIEAFAPPLKKEFALVGYNSRKTPSVEAIEGDGLARVMAAESMASESSELPANLLREDTATEFSTYATGRQNVAFAELKLSLFKRYSPLQLVFEYVSSAVFESFLPPFERMQVTVVPFDGREKEFVSGARPEDAETSDEPLKVANSTYDGFVWAIVHKDAMRHLREDRYDISLTATRDHARLPSWATIMSESAEITEALLTPELVQAVEQAGEPVFEHLIITDQPIDKPVKLDDVVPRKRVALCLDLPSSANRPGAYDACQALVAYVLRLPDQLINTARFRPEITRKLRGVREDEVRKLRRADEVERAEERKLEADRKKKAERDARLKSLSADEQRKMLEREREKENRKGTKRIKA